jgi:transcriptional regulator with XRE-family HTH domain
MEAASAQATSSARTVRQTELGDFLRARRALVRPTDVGFPEGDRRRTPGLRREEVAQLAGVSVSWYTWLEQGRDMRPSASVLDAIARVFALTSAERAHLFHLARVELPLAGGDYPRVAPPELAALVAALDPHPAYLTGPRLDVLAWNRAAAAVLVDFATLPADRRNLLWWLLVDGSPDHEGWRETASRTLARFRAQHARYVDHPEFAALITDLSEASPEFRAWWPRHEVVAEQSGTKAIDHPLLGPLRLHHLQSAPTSDPELRLTVYAPADDATRAALVSACA